MNQNRFELPESGVPLPDLETELRSRLPDPVYGHFSRAFRGPPDVQEAGRRAYNLFMSDNGLFSLRADYIRRTEEELIGMCVGLFHPPADASGTFTSGGSESNYTVIHAMREWAREQFPRVHAPELIVPFSAHPTFSKGCHYYGIRLVRTPLGEDRRADPRVIAQAINANTIGIAGSAPCWPYGLMDPIEELGELASRHNLWMHVDACVGGYLAPFAERIGVTLPQWDFRVPAVMSISADLHKYGYCPKPASTVLWRSESLKRFHHVHPEDWPGGPYHMQGFAGSRSAGPIFAAWTVLRYLGIEGYERLARQVLDTQQQLRSAIEAIEGLYTLKNDLPPLAFGSHSLDMALIMAELRKVGWILVASRQPPLINLPIDPALDERVFTVFVRDLEAAVKVARAGGRGNASEMRY